MACDILSFLLLPVIPIYRPQPKRGSSISMSVWTLWFWGLMEQIKIPHCFKLEHYSYRCWLLLLMVKIFFRSRISFSSIIIKCTLVGWQVYYWHVSIMLNGVKQDFVFPRISVWTFTCRIPFCTLVMCCCIFIYPTLAGASHNPWASSSFLELSGNVFLLSASFVWMEITSHTRWK